ncbi:hypothetical protein FACS189472_14300 [Alphaproteobacteria bacterium]|nr:hypothetical protein FACS189472_14300 [Alphaproteobacteria bacterium]
MLKNNIVCGACCALFVLGSGVSVGMNKQEVIEYKQAQSDICLPPLPGVKNVQTPKENTFQFEEIFFAFPSLLCSRYLSNADWKAAFGRLADNIRDLLADTTDSNIACANDAVHRVCKFSCSFSTFCESIQDSDVRSTVISFLRLACRVFSAPEIAKADANLADDFKKLIAKAEANNTAPVVTSADFDLLSRANDAMDSIEPDVRL